MEQPELDRLIAWNYIYLRSITYEKTKWVPWDGKSHAQFVWLTNSFALFIFYDDKHDEIIT